MHDANFGIQFWMVECIHNWALFLKNKSGKKILKGIFGLTSSSKNAAYSMQSQLYSPFKGEKG